MAGKINSRCVGHGKLHRRMAGVFDLIALSVGYLGYRVFHRSARGSKYLQLVAQQELVSLLRIYAEQRNKFLLGDKLEILAPSCRPVEYTVTEITDAEGDQVENTCHAAMKFSMPNTTGIDFPCHTIIRKRS